VAQIWAAKSQHTIAPVRFIQRRWPVDEEVRLSHSSNDAQPFITRLIGILIWIIRGVLKRHYGYIASFIHPFIHSFIHPLIHSCFLSVVCFTTRPYPLPKWVLYRVPPDASCFNFPVSSGFVKVIQQLFMPSSSSSRHFYPSFYRTFSNVFWEAVLAQDVTNPVSLPSFLTSFMRTCNFYFLPKTLHRTPKHPNTRRYEMYHTAVKAVCSMARYNFGRIVDTFSLPGPII